MEQIPKVLGNFILNAEPLVVALFFLGILGLGFVAKGFSSKTKKRFRFTRKGAETKELLE